jgi:hypothetical protein
MAAWALSELLLQSNRCKIFYGIYEFSAVVYQLFSGQDEPLAANLKEFGVNPR